MEELDWGRVLLSGIVASIVWYLLSAILLALVGGDLLDAVQRGRQYPPRDGLFAYSVDLAMGIWAMWVYAVIRPCYALGLKTAAVVGFAWWLIKSLESAIWVAVGFLPPTVVLVPLAVTLPAMIAATVVGA